MQLLTSFVAESNVQETSLKILRLYFLQPTQNAHDYTENVQRRAP